MGGFSGGGFTGRGSGRMPGSLGDQRSLQQRPPQAPQPNQPPVPGTQMPAFQQQPRQLAGQLGGQSRYGAAQQARALQGQGPGPQSQWQTGAGGLAKNKRGQQEQYPGQYAALQEAMKQWGWM